MQRLAYTVCIMVVTLNWTYFRNHCNITFDPIPKLKPKVIDPIWHLTTSLLRSHARFYPMTIKSKSNEIHQSIWIQWPFFSKTWTKGHWPWMTFDPTSVEVTCVTLPNDHCVQVPLEYIKECVYNDQFCKIPHTTYIHTYIHTISRCMDIWILYTIQWLMCKCKLILTMPNENSRKTVDNAKKTLLLHFLDDF